MRGRRTGGQADWRAGGGRSADSVCRRSAECVEQAARLGFAACGIASLEPSRYGGALDRWLGAGYGGTMRYLHRQARRRKDPATIVPGARAAVVVLENYLPPRDSGLRTPDSRLQTLKIAKYARGTDYHRALTVRLGELAAWLREQGATITRVLTDSGPVPERELAVRAGLGWIGKNTMLIRPGAGSFFLIGSVFTDLPLEPTGIPESPPPDLCGNCTRCLEACPTGALIEDRVLDATRCISYHTIESRAAIPPEIEARMKGWAFGCDICNDVCPWNGRFARPGERPEYREREAPDTGDPDYFDRLDPAGFAAIFGDTPLERPGLAGMRRNWAAAFASLEPEETG